MTDATPTPMPPTTRNKPNIQILGARPVPKALIRNSSAAIFITDEAADLVREPSGDHRTERRTDQRRRDGDTSHKLADLEVVFNRRHRAVDDRAVVAEQADRQARRRKRFGRRARCVRIPRNPDLVRIADGSVGHETTLPQHCVMEVTFNHIRTASGGAFPQTRTQFVNTRVAGPRHRRRPATQRASAVGLRALDVVGYHQHRASGALGGCGAGDRVLDGQADRPDPVRAAPRPADRCPVPACRRALRRRIP